MTKKLYEETAVQDIAAAIREKTGGAETYKIAQMGNAVRGIAGAKTVEWHQCPEAVRNYLASVTYDPGDYSNSEIANYAPATPVVANTKPIGKTVGGVTYYNEVPNVETPFSANSAAGTLKPLDALRWLNTTVQLATGTEIYPMGVNTRDLGGWACDGGTVKYGMLVRGGEPNPVDRTLMVEQVGIRSELYLLPKSEQKQGYSVWGIDLYANPEQDSFVWYSLDNTKLWKFYLKTVFDCVSHEKPVYFHCGIGADRTGTVAVMLEALLGMSQSDIDKDYELTNFYVVDSGSPRRRDVAQYKNYIAAIKAVPLVGGLADTFANHAISFAVTLGFTADEINAYRNACIDGTPAQIALTLPTNSVTNTLSNVSNSNDSTAVPQYQSYEAELTPADGTVMGGVSVTMGGVDITAQVFGGIPANLYRYASAELTNCTIDSAKKRVIDGQGYVANITANSGYTLDGGTVTITMGGVDVSNYYSSGKIAIPNVTGDIVITATAVPSAPSYTNLADPSSSEWLVNKRLNSGGQPVDSAGKTCANGIACAAGDIIYVKGAQGFSLTNTNDRIAIFAGAITGDVIYCDYGTVWLDNAENNTYGYLRKLADGYYALHINRANVANMRMCFNTPEDAASIIITRNEEIT